jgi:hypothetical protein
MNRLPTMLTVLAVAALRSSVALAYEPPPATPTSANEPPPGNAATAAPAAAAAPATTPEPAAAPVPVKPPEPEHSVAITFSPIHLLFPALELTGEIKITPKLSAAVILAYGRRALPSPYQDVKLTFLEGGGQVLFYPVGDFEHGMQLGVEGLVVSASGGGTVGSTKVVADGKGLSVGPIIGYKYTHKVGFTLNLQAGVGYIATLATASQSAGTTVVTASGTDGGIYPIVNLNFGWSF